VRKSVIMNFIMHVIHSFAAWFDASILEKIGNKCGKLWKKVTDKSFFANYFSTSSEKCEYRDSSVLFRLIKRFALFLRKYFSKLFAFASDSAICSSFRWYYDKFFDISISHYGVFLIAAAVSSFVLLVINGNLSLIQIAVWLAVAIIGFFAVLINLSFSNLFSGSIFVKCFGKMVTLKMPETKHAIPLSRVSAVVFAAFGIIYACLCNAIGFLYASLALVGLLGLGAVVYNFRIGVYVALIIFPYAPTMAIVGITLLSLLSLILKALSDDEFHFVRTSLDIPILIFGVMLLISTLTSYALISSVKIFMVYIVFVAGYFAITNAIKDLKTLMPVLALMIVASLGVALYGIYQHIFGFAEGTTWTDTDMFSDIATRVVSTFENPNVLGEYLLLLIPVGVAMFISSKSAFVKTENLLITLALGLCMIYTYSRGNWIGLIVAIAMFILFYDSRFVWLGVIALLAAPFVLSQSVITRFTSIGDTRDSSTSYRVYIWQGTFAMLKDYWICGIGLGTDAFNTVYPNYAYDTIVAPHSHNLYLQLLVENGILGFVSFMAIIVTYYKAVISKVIRQNRSLCKAIILMQLPNTPEVLVMLRFLALLTIFRLQPLQMKHLQIPLSADI